MTASGRVYGALIAQIFDPAPDPATAIIAFFEGAAAVLEATGYEDACPIAVIALEAASTSEPLRIATRDVFRSWLDLLVERYLAAGIVDDQARDLALLSLSTLEGAFILARTERSVAPMHACGRLVGSLIRAALPAGRAEV